eukprot:scaffold47429_cov52-Phaeocystis_antarctica.AAC.1
MAGHLFCGHGLREPSGSTVASIALMTVTHAPATTAWPAGHEGCVGDPSGYCSARARRRASRGRTAAQAPRGECAFVLSTCKTTPSAVRHARRAPPAMQGGVRDGVQRGARSGGRLGGARERTAASTSGPPPSVHAVILGSEMLRSHISNPRGLTPQPNDIRTAL